MTKILDKKRFLKVVNLKILNHIFFLSLSTSFYLHYLFLAICILYYFLLFSPSLFLLFSILCQFPLFLGAFPLTRNCMCAVKLNSYATVRYLFDDSLVDVFLSFFFLKKSPKMFSSFLSLSPFLSLFLHFSLSFLILM